jgi:uncharacterized protein (TIGR02266 family)
MDKRDSKRILSRVKVLFGPQAPEYLGFALNMSAKGLYLSSTRVFHPPTGLRIRMEPIGAAAVNLGGLVCWSLRVPPNLVSVVKPGMGIKLDSPTRDYLDLFSRLVKMSPQRSNPRLEARLEVRFYHRELLIKEFTENICRGGFFIATDEVFEPGDEIRVDLVIPDLATVWQVIGRVAYCLDAEKARQLESPTGVGIEITKTDPRVEEAFRAYVQRIMRLYE